MGSLTKWRPYTAKLGDDDVTMEVRPLKVRHFGLMMEFAGMAQNIAGQKKDDMERTLKDDPKALDGMFEFQTKCEDVFADCVRNVAMNGEPIEPQELAQEFVYTTVAMQVVTHLMQISSLGESERKNSSAPSSRRATAAR